jgi:hypothetical protein
MHAVHEVTPCTPMLAYGAVLYEITTQTVTAEAQTEPATCHHKARLQN